jgi:2-iminobutanoate/2-iminopropanoate deaminase
VDIKPVHTDKAPAAIGPYSQGVVANGFFFTAGQIALDPATGQVVPGNVVAQTDRVMTNLTAVLAAAGATWKQVVKTTVFLQDMADFPLVNEAYARALATRGRLAPRCRLPVCRGASSLRSRRSRPSSSSTVGRACALPASLHPKGRS